MIRAVCIACGLATPSMAEDGFVLPVGCVPEVRVDWHSCVSSVIYRCDGGDDVAWVHTRSFGQIVNVALSYDAQGNLIRQLGTHGFEDGPIAEYSDPFDFERLQETRSETVAFTMGTETNTAELFLDRGFRFHTDTMMMRADLIGGSSAPERDYLVFDESAYFLPGIPVMMVHLEDPRGVVWAKDVPALAAGQEC